MKKEDNCNLIPKADWLTKIIYFYSDTIYNCIMTLLSPLIATLGIASDSYHRAEEAVDAVESGFLEVPSTVTHGATTLLRKIGFGIVGAVYVCMVMIVVMLLAAMLGVGLVHLWVEEPVFMRERIFFDYTDVNPTAGLTFGGLADDGSIEKGLVGIPLGHTFHVSLALLMPESDHNRQIGMFQLTAEVLSADGNVMAKSSQPCMLRFRSLPIRLARTFLMGVPLVLGISEETQKISIKMLQLRERHPRSKAIRVTLIPRAGTVYLPQLYEAEILLVSKLPWTKELVRNWKWTFSVWASIYIYITILVIILSCCRALVFPITAVNLSCSGDSAETEDTGESKESRDEAEDEKETSELWRKWQQRTRKRKATVLHGEIVDGTECSSASITREDTSMAVDEEDIVD
ncbi:SEIPIN-1 [Salix purpurea]|uniref:SEIPIN-1 n=1 Tax=Salix purpurea TaxID=77065 RepID=A0A9Q0WAA6_SALPP|nr:SEIPIN-1 [Salix purpurea]